MEKVPKSEVELAIEQADLFKLFMNCEGTGWKMAKSALGFITPAMEITGSRDKTYTQHFRRAGRSATLVARHHEMNNAGSMPSEIVLLNTDFTAQDIKDLTS